MFRLFFVNQALGNHRWYIILRWYFIQESLLLQNELTQYITNKTAASAAEDNISITSVTYSVPIIFYLSRCMIRPRILEIPFLPIWSAYFTNDLTNVTIGTEEPNIHVTSCSLIKRESCFSYFLTTI